MNALSFFGYAIALALAPVAPFIIARWVRAVWHAAKALRVLSRERRTGETLYDCAEAIAGDAHNWRETSTEPERLGDAVAAMVAIGREMKPDELSVLPAVSRLVDDAQKWREFEEVADASALTLDDDANAVPASGVRIGDSVDRAKSTDLIAPQPPPQNSDGPALWPLIISELGDSETDRLVAIDMQQRHKLGMVKYGAPLVASNGRDHLADAYQEALDGVVYLRAAASLWGWELAQSVKDGTETDEQENRCGHIWQLYIDMLDMAKEIRELIRDRDGK